MQATSRLVALDVALDVIQLLGPVVRSIRAQDKNLADQLRRAATSMALNLSESMGSDDGNARARLHSALGSTRETRTALRIAAAWGYIEPRTLHTLDAQLDRTTAMTFRLLHPRGGVVAGAPTYR
jgi:four helix bundle protein